MKFTATEVEEWTRNYCLGHKYTYYTGNWQVVESIVIRRGRCYRLVWYEGTDGRTPNKYDTQYATEVVQKVVAYTEWVDLTD